MLLQHYPIILHTFEIDLYIIQSSSCVLKWYPVFLINKTDYDGVTCGMQNVCMYVSCGAVEYNS